MTRRTAQPVRPTPRPPAHLPPQAGLHTRPQGFQPADAAGLPDPARHWLTQAIAPGTAPHRAATITMHGTIHLARGWRGFTATRYLDPERGFSWDAQAKIAGLTATGYDGLTDDGEVHWRLLGASFGHSGTTADITHSAIDRLAAESVLIPTTLLEADWRDDTQPGTASFACPVTGRQASSRITVRVNPTGRLRMLTLSRWGNPRRDRLRPVRLPRRLRRRAESARHRHTHLHERDMVAARRCLGGSLPRIPRLRGFQLTQPNRTAVAMHIDPGRPRQRS
jgi:hypothetical protein